MEKETYKSRLGIKVEKELKNYNITQYEYLMANEYIDSNYKDNREGFLSFLENMFFKELDLTLQEYQKLFDLAYKVRNVRRNK